MNMMDDSKQFLRELKDYELASAIATILFAFDRTVHA
jgi:hypothetical protein